MLEHGIGSGRYVVVRVGAAGQAGVVAPEEVVDRDMDGISRRLFLAPLVDAELLRLQRLQQLDGDPLDPLDVRRAQIRFPQKIEDRQ